MKTGEHKEVGDSITYQSSFKNPYLQLVETKTNGKTKKVLHVAMMHDKEGVPKPLGSFEKEKGKIIPQGLTMSAGEIIAMSGDYYTKAGWAMGLDIPKVKDHIERGTRIINDDVEVYEIKAFIGAFDNLANEDVSREQIDEILKIAQKKYIPFSSKLTNLIQQLIFTLKFKGYGNKADKNAAHFTPWSVRAYIIGHMLSLHQMQITRDLLSCIENQDHTPQCIEVNDILEKIATKDYAALGFDTDCELSKEQILKELAYRFHAMGVAMELYDMHYFSDTFASGHMSRMGFIRTELPKHFGKLGGILVNSMHNEDNKVGINVDTHYDPDEDSEISDPAQGDGDVNSCLNRQNKKNCIKGMTLSLAQLETMLQTGTKIEQKNYAGFKKLPDVDMNLRQPKPMFILYNHKLYYRTNIKRMQVIGPNDYERLLKENPESHGYQQIKSKWHALKLVVKIRSIQFIFGSKLKALTKAQEKEILKQEREKLNDPDYEPEKVKTPCDNAKISKPAAKKPRWDTYSPQLSFFNDSSTSEKSSQENNHNHSPQQGVTTMGFSN
jgi:hypothetical protein